MKRLVAWVALALLCTGFAPGLAGEGENLAGTWLTAAGDAKIQVGSCDASLCGVIVWLKNPIDPTTGKPQIDDKNANKALAKRPIIGLNIFSAMRPDGNKWSGKIYNADDGKTYSSELHLAGARKLEVRGCVLSFLCGGETWTKVNEVNVASANQ